MKRMILKMILLLIMVIVATVAFCADPVLTAQMPTDEFLKLIIASIGGIKGASTLGIIAIVLKLLFAFLNSSLSGKIGFMRGMGPGTKLFWILAISYASGIASLMSVSGLSFGAAFIHSSSMSAMIVLMNQGYKKFIEKKKNPLL